ncbi:MAG TPA: hypothetical protein VE979_22520 [Streptosporangiaceae bacterium]|nr:hypothetical protein [Streptosporangiaceae bacterium]
MATLTGLRAAGLIEAAGDGAIAATKTGRAVLAGMYQAGAEVTGQLWGQHGDALAGLSDLAGRVVQAGLATGGDAYLALAPPYEPADATAGVLLHHRLSVLRYHRADAHAAAWQAAGLTSEDMMQLPAGPVRAAIEAETNRSPGPTRWSSASSSPPSPATTAEPDQQPWAACHRTVCSVPLGHSSHGTD